MNEDPLLSEAVKTVCQYDRASTSLLQRKLSIGYARASKLIDRLAEIGIVSKPKGTKPVDILIRNPEEAFKLAVDSSSIGPHPTRDETVTNDKSSEVSMNQDNTLTRVINELYSNPIIRQELMKKLEVLTGRHIITYVSSFANNQGAIVSDGDAEIIENILRSYHHIDKLDLLIHSPGGIAESAERIIEVIYTYCDDLRVIVPKQAKSAATMMAMGASEIIMSDTSEIGSIDPQMSYGNIGQIAVQSIIKAHNQIKKEIAEKQRRAENYDAELIQLSKIDPILLREAQKNMDLAKDIAIKLLNKRMFIKSPIKKDDVDKYLDDSETFSHGRLIDWNTAKKKLGLVITHIDKFSDEWMLIWEIYIRTTNAIGQNRYAKLIEDENNSLTTGVLPS